MCKKTEREISLSDQMDVGDVYIGTGETDANILGEKENGVYL